MRRALFILLALAAPAFPDLATAEQLTAQGQSPANVSTTVAPSPARQMQTKQDEIEEEVLEEEEKEEKELEEEEENSALQLVVIVSLLALALVVGRIMHRRHILSIPESGVTILVGLFTGFAVHFLFPGQSVREQSFYFDPEFFSLFLLPPIIFESGFSLNQALFFRNFGSILTFAVVGTLISTALMWTLIYSLGQAGFIFHLSMVEAGAFSALISAVDPVATLATFSALQADPELHNLVFGESVLNDAVSIVVFRSILEFYLTPFYAHNIPSVVLAFFKTATFSAVIGFFVAAAAALTFKGLGMAHHAGDGDLSAAVFECSLFWAFSYLSYVASEALYLSGIVSTLFAGIFMARYVTPNLTRRGLRLTAGAYRVIATLADFLVFLLVGMAIVVYYADINHMYWRFFLVSFAGCIATRALNIFPLAFILNRCFRTKPIPRKFQYVMWFSGLRGAIAVALSVQLPGPRKGAVIVNTMFVVLASIFLLGGGTFRLLQRLEIQMGDPGGGDTELRRLTGTHLDKSRARGGREGDGEGDVVSRLTPVRQEGEAEAEEAGKDAQRGFSAWIARFEQRVVLSLVVDHTIPGHEEAWSHKDAFGMGTDTPTVVGLSNRRPGYKAGSSPVGLQIVSEGGAGVPPDIGESADDFGEPDGLAPGAPGETHAPALSRGSSRTREGGGKYGSGFSKLSEET